MLPTSAGAYPTRRYLYHCSTHGEREGGKIQHQENELRLFLTDSIPAVFASQLNASVVEFWFLFTLHLTRDAIRHLCTCRYPLACLLSLSLSLFRSTWFIWWRRRRQRVSIATIEWEKYGLISAVFECIPELQHIEPHFVPTDWFYFEFTVSNRAV